MREMRRVLDTALSEIWKSKNKGFMALQWMIVTDSHHLSGQSLTEMARPYGRGRQALSKGCRDVCEKANLPPSSYMRSLEAVESYRDRQNKKVRDGKDEEPNSGAEANP